LLTDLNSTLPPLWNYNNNQGF